MILCCIEYMEHMIKWWYLSLREDKNTEREFGNSVFQTRIRNKCLLQN